MRTALRELNAFLLPKGDLAAVSALGDLDECCDVFLFYGLTLSERIEVEEGMVLLPYGELLRFVDEETVRDLAPSGAGFHSWRPMGAVARPFRWRPEFRRRGSVNEPVGPPPPPFFRNAAVFLDLLAVSHATRVAPLAALSDRIDSSAGRLLGQEKQSLGFYQRWPAEGFSGFDRVSCDEGRRRWRKRWRRFRNRETIRYERMAPIITRLSEALATEWPARGSLTGLWMSQWRFERMHVLDENKIGRKLRSRTARLLGTDAASEHEKSSDKREGTPMPCGRTSSTTGCTG